MFAAAEQQQRGIIYPAATLVFFQTSSEYIDQEHRNPITLFRGTKSMESIITMTITERKRITPDITITETNPRTLVNQKSPPCAYEKVSQVVS